MGGNVASLLSRGVRGRVDVGLLRAAHREANRVVHRARLHLGDLHEAREGSAGPRRRRWSTRRGGARST